MAIRTTYKYACDLDKGTYEVNLRNALMQADSQADAFRVSVTRNGADVDVDGMNAYGYLYVASNQTTIALAGTVSGNTAEVVLTSDCYAVPGYASLVIQLHDGDVRHSVLKVNMHIERTGSNRVLTGGDVLPTLAELLNKISAMEQATATAHATIATIKADTAAAIKTTNEATAAANTATVELAKTAAPAITPTVSGSLVTITDGAERPAVSLISHIEPVQEGEGDPSPDNVRPISGWDSVTAQRTGKSLFNFEWFNTLECAIIGGYYRSKSHVLPQGKYVWTGIEHTSAIENINMRLVNASGTAWMLVQMGTVINAITIDSAEPLYLELNCFFESYYKSSTLNAQLEIGSTATACEPYQGQTLTASLPETVYGGTVDWGTGVLTVDYCGRVLTGDEQFGTADNGDNIRYSLTLNERPASEATGIQTISSHFVGTDSAWIKMKNNTIQAWKTYFMIACSDYATVDEFKVFLAGQYAAGTPVQVAYKLATPYTIQLTPQQLETLKGTNNVWSDTGDTDLTYIADTQLYIDKKLAAIAAASL